MSRVRACLRHITCLLSLILLLTGASNLNAQINRGVLEGLVTDPQGASMAGVQVEVIAVDTNITSRVTTNDAGSYRAVDLVPGKYRARFSFSGFATLDLTDIDVPAGKVTRLDTQMRVDATRQTVEVKAETPLLESGAANFSTTLETKTIQEVPLQGRDLQQLVFLVPGINNVGGPPGSNFGFNSQYGTFPDPTHVLGSDLSVNGGQGGANAWYLDGNLNLSSFAENVAVNPSPDAVAEFQAITNAFAAEYSRTGGGVFNVVLKSGTNQLHGNLYEFLRNDATNARNPFTSIDEQGHLIKDRQLRFNNFGFTVGGPVVLPHVYNGKDKTFFFFSSDFTKLHLLGYKNFTVPTARMRQGDFSEDADVISNGLWDPYSTVGPNADGLFERRAFGTPVAGNPFGGDGCQASAIESGKASGNPTCNFATQIPQSRLDPTAMYFMKSFPMPNYNDPLSSCPMGKDGFKICNNFQGAIGSSQDPSNFSLKFDHQWSDKSRYFVEWLYNPGKYRNYRVPWTGATFPYDYVGWGSNYPVDFNNQIISIGNTYSIRPTLINEFRLGFSRQWMSTNPSSPYPDNITDQKAVAAKLQANQIPSDPFFPVPNWNIGTPGGGNIRFGPTTWVNMNTAAEAYTLLDNVTKIIGKHTLKTGFVYRLEHTAYESGFPTGFGFGGELVQDPNTNLGGSGLAQFMLGAVASGGRGSYTGVMWKPYERFRYWGFFIQDDVRITSNFTLNLGLRYDINGLYRTRQGPNSNFCLGCPNAETGLKGKVVYEGDPGFPKGDIAPAKKNNIEPRVNFSWSPFHDRKTVIRGGYNIFSSNAFASINSPGQSAANAPGWNQEYDWNGSFYPNQCAKFSGQCVVFPLSDTSVDKRTLTTPPYPSTFPGANRDPLIGIGLLQFFTPPAHDPMVQTWGLEVQRELPGNMLVSVGYVGNHGTHLVGEPFRQFNFVHTADRIKYRTAIDANVPITDYYSGATAAKLQEVYGGAELPRSFLLKDYPFYGAISALQNNTAFEGTSIYHGMNVRVQKRYSQGLDFVLAYTFSKKMVNASTGQTAAMLVDPIHWGTRAGGIGGRGGSLSGGYGGSFQDIDNKNLDRAIAADDITHMLNIAASYELPIGKNRQFLRNSNRAVDAVIGGWRLTGNFNAQGGLPMSISGPCNELTCRPNVIGNPNFSGSRSREQQINQWANPAAFEPVFGGDQNFWANYDPNDDRAWRFGTAGARLPWLRSPGFWNIDTSLAKQFHLNEQRYFEFRWELFNALNHQNLGFPDTNFCLPPLADGTTDTVHQDGCQFGRITNIQTDPRSMQFSLKFFF
ncbi:MAG TPA: carboxypeptidase-like regulatory domain-containing protein [Bryobacteraceae bacterium]|nr:carboxypeptidase-like regulatory domain-containing protein [Bryobacteraceae bacterium]